MSVLNTQTQKQSEVLSAIRSNLEESDIDGNIKSRMLSMLDDLNTHLGLDTCACHQEALMDFASRHSSELFPVVGPLIETLCDPV